MLSLSGITAYFTSSSPSRNQQKLKASGISSEVITTVPYASVSFETRFASFSISGVTFSGAAEDFPPQETRSRSVKVRRSIFFIFILSTPDRPLP